MGHSDEEQKVLGRINRLLSFHYILSILYNTDCIENTASNSSVVAAGTCLPNLCLATAVFWLYCYGFQVLGGGDMQTRQGDLISLPPQNNESVLIIFQTGRKSVSTYASC
jgi:hypothetical protein